jgi:peptide/nickel transport system substrate-binding protein
MFRGRVLAGTLALALALTACGGDGDDGAEGTGPDTTNGEDNGEQATGGGGDIIFGTTDTVVTLDPAKAYDFASSNILFNVGETSVGFPPGETEPAPLLAEDWEVSDDGLTYTFTIREGVTFSNGHELTSEDVKFSLERVIDMAHPAGAASMLFVIDSIETPDERTAVVTLSAPNSTFLPRLAYTVATIVPSDGHYPAPTAAIEERGRGARAGRRGVRQRGPDRDRPLRGGGLQRG